MNKKLKSYDREKIYLSALSNIASNLGSGSLVGSDEDKGSRPLRVHASQALKQAGFHYQENPDGWVNETDKIFYPDSPSELTPARWYNPLDYIGWTIYKK